MATQSPERKSDEFTIDELAKRVNMTVRNVRAYASRGIIPPPRLEGRTGYYNATHEQRLRLVREFLDRGYTLAAIQQSIAGQSEATVHHALDLLTTLDTSGGEDSAEFMSVDSLAGLVGFDTDGDWLKQLVAAGLVDDVGSGQVLVHDPSVLRAGGAAVRMGLSTEKLLAIVPKLHEHLSAVASVFVDSVVDDIWHPFVADEMPAEQWPEVLKAVENLLPIAGQAVLAVFRTELDKAIERALDEEALTLPDPSPKKRRKK